MILYKKILDSEEVKEYLLEFDNILPNLKNRVKIDTYAKKIAEKAEVYVMYDFDEVIGILVFYANDCINYNAYLSIIGIAADYQNKHYGQKLLLFCESECCKKGMKKIRLEVRQERK